MNFKKDEIFIFGFFLLFLLIGIFIIKDFLLPIIFTAILVYILHPLYKLVDNKINNTFFVSLLFSLIILLVFILPLTYSIVEFSKELNFVTEKNIEDSLTSVNLNFQDTLGINFHLDKAYETFVGKLKEQITNFFFKIPSFLFNIFLIIFFYYFFSKYYRKEENFINSLFENEKFFRVKHKIKSLVDAIIYGQLIVKLIQSLVGTFGFLLLGIDGAIILGILMFFVSFIPILGTSLIWLPIAFLYFIKGKLLISFLIILLGLFISILDNILLPYVISSKSQINPVVILIGIIGGINIFNIYGIILGPLFLGILTVIIKEILLLYGSSNISLRKYIWSESERSKYRNLKTQKAKNNYQKKLTKKYSFVN